MASLVTATETLMVTRIPMEAPTTATLILTVVEAMVTRMAVDMDTRTAGNHVTAMGLLTCLPSFRSV